MKKHEGAPSMCASLGFRHGPQCFRVVVMRALLLVVMVGGVASAQEFSPPPMVQADIVDPNQGRELQPPVIANAPLDPNTLTPAPQSLPTQPSGTLQPQAPQAPQPNYQLPQQQNGQPQPGTVQRAEPVANPRFVRIGMSALLGAGFGTITSIIGGFVGGEYLRPGITSIGNIWTGGAIGFAVGAPIGVLVSGLIFRGDAPWWAPILGDLVGAAVGAGAVALAGPDALSATFVLPLLGSIIGYEMGSADDATVAPTVTMLPGRSGAIVGVSGRF